MKKCNFIKKILLSRFEGFTFGDFIKFRYFITPGSLATSYIIAAAAGFYGAIRIVDFEGTWGFIMFVGGIIISQFTIRMGFEVLIVLFSIFGELKAINKTLGKLNKDDLAKIAEALKDIDKT